MSTGEWSDNKELRDKLAEIAPDKIRWHGGQWQWRPSKNHAWRGCYLSDPILDLNAMHEAEKVLTNDQRQSYSSHLQPIGGSDDVICWDLIHATARQRAEAFLATLQGVPSPESVASTKEKA